MGKMFLIVVDSHSEWFEVEIMPSITCEATIAKLRDMFSRYGILQQLVSDNGSQFTSEEFCKFMKANGIKHARTCCSVSPSIQRLGRAFCSNVQGIF